MMDTPASAAAETPAAPRSQVVRGLLAAALDALRTRLDLAAVEFEIHMLALVRTLVWIIAAAACGLLGLAFAVTALVVSLWNTHPVAALLGGCLLFIGLAVVFVWMGARTLRAESGLFEGSLAQLGEDTRRARGTP
jgi:uncharacterized membrane protein YqjE